MIEVDFSDHAKKSMDDDLISEQEVIRCLEHGETEIKQAIDGEMRYGKQIEFKDKKIMVIYTLRKEKYRVITAYTIQKKRVWQEKNRT